MATTKYQTEFNISVKGDVTGEDWKGNFTVKTRLSHFDQLQRDEIRRRLLGPSPDGQVPGDQAAVTAEIFSQLAVRVVKAPSWWTGANNGIDLIDSTPVTAVYEAAIKAEKDEIERLKNVGAQAEKELKTELAPQA